MLKFNAQVNDKGEFVLTFRPEYRDEIIDTYSKAKGYQEFVNEVAPNQEGIPAQFQVTIPVANPMSKEEFICRLIERSIANVILEPEIQRAAQQATQDVINASKTEIPL